MTLSADGSAYICCSFHYLLQLIVWLLSLVFTFSRPLIPLINSLPASDRVSVHALRHHGTNNAFNG
jgi:hypothetical protein